MHIAGGLYRELCEVPFWDATLGSGGRAARAIVALSPGSHLHTYAAPEDKLAIEFLQKSGLKTSVCSRPSSIVFAYFHPLSRPHIQPDMFGVERQPPIEVDGDAVLRFGFLEGEAIVNANRAVYDPQTWRDPEPFLANGSTANELAIVLNELELQSATGQKDIKQAAELLMKTQNAAVVVVKGGIRGATVFENTGKMSQIPAYLSAQIFKIGTGDIFSAIFAFHWAERKLPPAEAALWASRSVSVYSETQKFSFQENSLSSRVPISSKSYGHILLEGCADSLGQRYVMEEARFALSELGIKVNCPELNSGTENADIKAVLIIAHGFRNNIISRIKYAQDRSIPVVVLNELSDTSNISQNSYLDTTDFTTALYHAAWAAGNDFRRG
ncbi:TPA: carbohydrate kinase family protein [Salmonella enterica subsp. salamae serovar 52:z:z39]|nr:carbohydrate kinase family protein [Salmonella enterica subsp. salamae serovar 52:z:z39]